jgi:hypothetical protein
MFLRKSKLNPLNSNTSSRNLGEILRKPREVRRNRYVSGAMDDDTQSA